MKKYLLITVASFVSLFVYAQDDDKTIEEVTGAGGGFKKEMLFTGGNINIGYFSGVTVLGATPQLGYNIARWLDAGIIFGYTYTSQGISVNEKIRQTILGPGAFVRLFPIDFIFASIQYEHNFLRQKYIYSGGSQVTKTNVGSLLLGLGYTSGRMGRNSPYYYFSVSIDVLNNRNSPYRTFANEVYPVVNAGFNIPLFQNRGNR